MAELLTCGCSVRSVPGLLDLACVLEDSTGAEPAERLRRSLLPRAASADITESALHVTGGQERARVLIEGLELVLLEAAQEVRREGVHGVPLVAG